MGWTPKTRLHRLIWPEDAPYFGGLEVTMRSMPVTELLSMARMATTAGSATLTEEDLKLLEDLYSTVATGIVEWNVEMEEGTPTPPSAEALKALDFDFLIELIGQWVTAMTEVDAPLPQQSSSGGPPDSILSDLVMEDPTDPIGSLGPLPS